MRISLGRRPWRSCSDSYAILGKTTPSGRWTRRTAGRECGAAAWSGGASQSVPRTSGLATPLLGAGGDCWPRDSAACSGGSRVKIEDSYIGRRRYLCGMLAGGAAALACGAAAPMVSYLGNLREELPPLFVRLPCAEWDLRPGTSKLFRIRVHPRPFDPHARARRRAARVRGHLHALRLHRRLSGGREPHFVRLSWRSLRRQRRRAGRSAPSAAATIPFPARTERSLHRARRGES